MRAQCSICADLFDGEAPVAALIECGHTFHDGCLNDWFNQSMTCPQCRKKVSRKKGIIHRLFFDIEADGRDDGASSSKLENEVSTLKASLREKDRVKGFLEEEKVSLQTEIEQLNQEKKNAEKTLRMEKTASSMLRKEMAGFQQQQLAAAEAIKEAHRLRTKLQDLTVVQTVVQGLECDVQDMITAQGDVKQLATWCTVLKRELGTKRTEYKKIKEQFDRVSKENSIRKRDSLEKSRTVTTLQEQIKHSEEDLKRAEREIDSLKKKINLLQNSIDSLSNTKDSLVHRIINESPAPQPLKKRPRMSTVSSDEEQGLVDLNLTPDLFSPSPHKPSPATQAKKTCQEFGTQFVKISKAASSQRTAREVSDISNKLPYNMNIFKKSSTGGSGFMKKGYNGLGGHGKFVQPFVKPSSDVVAKKPGKLSAKMRNLGPAPALPTLYSLDS